MKAHKIRPGDRVVVKGRRTGLSRRFQDGMEVAMWDFDKGSTGTVVRVWTSKPASHVSHWVTVVPDSECGHGECTFLGSDLRRLEAKDAEE